MAVLVSFDAQGQWGKTLLGAQVREALRARGLDCGHWPVRPVQEAGDQGLDAILKAYESELAHLRARLDIQSIDRVSLKPGHAGWAEQRRKFTTEHTHADAEIRYFLGGRGLFYIRAEDGWLGLLCEAGDWVEVPAETQHFFDAGDEPDFDALRLFTLPDGWVALPTGAAVPALPLLDDFVERLTTSRNTSSIH